MFGKSKNEEPREIVRAVVAVLEGDCRLKSGSEFKLRLMMRLRDVVDDSQPTIEEVETVKHVCKLFSIELGTLLNKYFQGTEPIDPEYGVQFGIAEFKAVLPHEDNGLPSEPFSAL